MYTADYKTDSGEEKRVAVKLLRVKASNSDREEFLAEADLMLLLDHPLVVKVIGLCFSRKPWLLVLEFMPFKDLGFLMWMCVKYSLKLRMHEYLNYAVQISEGMSFIASVRF